MLTHHNTVRSSVAPHTLSDRVKLENASAQSSHSHVVVQDSKCADGASNQARRVGSTVGWLNKRVPAMLGSGVEPAPGCFMSGMYSAVWKASARSQKSYRACVCTCNRLLSGDCQSTLFGCMTGSAHSCSWHIGGADCYILAMRMVKPRWNEEVCKDRS